MSDQSVVHEHVRRLARFAAMAAIAVSALVLAGWSLHVPAMASGVPGKVAMNPLTAMLFILAAASLWLLAAAELLTTRRIFAQVLATLVGLGGASILMVYVAGWETGPDRVLFAGELGSNRMAPNTALLFVLTGLALLLVPAQRVGFWISHALTLLVAIAALMSLVGYSYGTKTLYGIASYIPMAFNTAVLFEAVALGILCARPERGLAAVLAAVDLGGVMARRLLPAAILIPCLLGLFRIFGQRAGWYDTEFGAALMVVLNVAILVAAVIVTASALNQADAERRQAMKALGKTVSEVRDLYNNAPCGYHSLDEHGMIVAINDTELQWLGYSREEVVGCKRFADVITPESLTKFEAQFALLKSSGRVDNLEYTMVRKDGSVFPVALNSTVIRDAAENFVASRSSLFDITQRRQAETEVQLYTDVVSQLPIGLTIWRLQDPQDVRSLLLVSANQASSDLLGVDVSLLIGNTILEAFPAVQNAELETYARVARTGEGCEIAECIYGDARVATNIWSVKAFPLPDRCVGLAFENISQRKADEERIKQLNEELERRVNERTAELANANRDLTQKNQENEMFVYSVSHDLRSPLVSLQGFSKELGLTCDDLQKQLAVAGVSTEARHQAQALIDGGMRQSIRFIQSAVLRLSNIIDALLRLSRAGRVEYQHQEVDVQSVVMRVVEATRLAQFDGAVEIHVGDLPACFGDLSAIEQVFANLIGNAIKYRDPNRHCEIEVGGSAVIKEDDAGERVSEVRYFVKDTGLGIPAASREKIFLAFKRAHPAIAEGDGMGLAIVRRVVERLGGRVCVESEVGRGSTFHIVLPASNPAKSVTSIVANAAGDSTNVRRTDGHLACRG